MNALNIDGTLSIGGSLVRSMSSNKSYMEGLYNTIVDNSHHSVCLERITLTAEVIEEE